MSKVEILFIRCAIILMKGNGDMPNHTLTMDVLDEMIENISVVKLNTYIRMIKDK